MRKTEALFIEELAGAYPADEAKQMARLLLQDVLDCDFTHLVIKSPLCLTDEQQKMIDAALARLKKGEPLQYVEGLTCFCGRPFVVRPGVLIPRPETAELVEWVVTDMKAVPAPRLLDVGTGSGCIAVSLAAELKGAQVHAVDVSTDALKVAGENACKNGVEVSFLQLDVLSDEPVGIFKAIVSNPPYICDSEKADMRNNVLDFEPHIALFVPDSDPLLFYRRIAELGLKHLADGGFLYFEINERFGAETVLMLQQLGYADVQLRNDFYEKPRMVRATKV